MRILVVKTSSLGDVIHTLPALSDAKAARPEIEFDWMVEETFTEIPALHPAVSEVIPVAFRRWRKSPLSSQTRHAWRAFRSQLADRQYDLVIDAQGLVKSALLARQANAPVAGLDRGSIREPLASFTYRDVYSVDKKLHAIERVRTLFSQILNYPLTGDCPNYGISVDDFRRHEKEKYVVFLHGATWSSKRWPDEHWVELAKKVNEEGISVFFPWGNKEERKRAEWLSSQIECGRVLDRLSLKELCGWLAHAHAVVGVDSGLVHLATALNVPSLALFGASNIELTGVRGERQTNINADFKCLGCRKRECSLVGQEELPSCLEALTPSLVWNAYKGLE